MKILLISLLVLYLNELTVDAFRGTMLRRGKVSLQRLSSSQETPTFDRTFASYVVYKSKAAVSIKVIPPTFQAVGTKSRTVAREGGLLFEFATSSGPREYDWTKKGTFLVDATECGDLLSLDTARPNVEFIHDPNAGADKAGQIMKKMKWSYAPDGKALYLSLQVSDKNQTPPSTGYSLPVSFGEFNVIKSVISYALPRFLGFDKVWDNGGLGTPGEQAPPPPPVPVYKNFWGNDQEQWSAPAAGGGGASTSTPRGPTK